MYQTQESPVSDFDAPVIIVGAGPAGLSLALNLARLGMRSMIVEKRPDRGNHPRAHYVNTRTAELFHIWGIERDMVAVGFPVEFLPFSTLAMFGGPTDEERDLMAPARVGSCAQDLIEGLMLKVLDGYGLCDIRYGMDCVSVTDHGSSVEVVVAKGAERTTLKARWCAAADGSGSPVRRALGVEMIGDPDLGSVMNMYFLGRLIPEDAIPSIGVLSSDPELRGAFLSMDGKERWCFHCHYDPKVEGPADFDVVRATSLIRRAAGLADDVPIDVKSIRPWTMTALVAERMRVGSIFLLGDAAHAFPPTGGFGMNSGIQDGHNLAWKLKAVFDGLGGEALLDSYDAERRPVAFLNTAQSFRNNRTQNLSGNEAVSPISDATLATIESFATKSVRSSAAEQTDPDERERIEMIEHYASVGQELGFAYDQSAVIVNDGVPRPDVLISKYIANASPGARAPHIALKHGAETVSSIAVFDGAFTLVTAAGGSDWRDAAALIPESLGLKSISIGAGQDYDPGDVDFMDIYGLDADGAVLIRPDGHVSFRSKGKDADALTTLATALATSYGV
jgi:putative polyketide hydroxylase